LKGVARRNPTNAGYVAIRTNCQPRWDLRDWIFSVRLLTERVAIPPDHSRDHLDAGETEAIALAEEVHADYVLLDETAARRCAARRNLLLMGTLGIPGKAAQLEQLDLRAALSLVERTVQ